MNGENATAMTVSLLLEQRASAEPDRLAMIVAGGDRRITFAEWKQHSDAVAAGVAARGIGRGDRVGLVFDGTEWIDFAVAFCGVLRAGAVAVPLSASRPSAALAAMIGLCDAAAVIHGTAVTAPNSAADRILFADVADVADKANEADTVDEASGGARLGGLDLAAPPQPGDPAQILFTSGTTAFPKGVVASHANLTYGSGAGRRRRPLSHSERFVHAFPIGTNAATMMLTTTLVAQPTAVVQPAFDAEGFCALIEAHRAGTVYLIPPAAAEILNSGAADRHDMSCVQLVNSAAAALPPAVARRLAAAFPGAVLVNSYTSTEASPAQTAMIVDPTRPGSVGRPVGAGDIRILAEDGRPAAVGEVGDVHLRSAAPQRSYFRDPAGTAEVFGSGWTKMGDVGYLDADGYLFLTDRDSDVVKTGGHRVSTLHVEAVLLEHPAVGQVAVLGLPHATMGTMVGAVVVLRDSADSADATEATDATDAQELREFARGRLARHEVPGQILVVGELPRNPTGKVVKRSLLPLFGSALAAGPQYVQDTEAAKSDDVGRRIAGVWSRVFGGTVAPGADFFAAGGDSLRASQLAVLVRDEFGVDVPGSFAFDMPAPAMQAAWLRTATARMAPAEADEAAEEVGAAEAAAAEAQTPPAAEAGQRSDSVGNPLTGVQEHWWRWLNEVPGTRQMPPVHMAVRIRDRLDLEALDRALVDLAVRHDALRSVVSEHDGVPRLMTQDAREFYLVRRTAEGPDAAARLAHAAEVAAAEVRRPFDVTAGPLFRALAITVDTDDHVVVLCVHHIVFDGWSSGLLLRDLARQYSARLSGAASTAPSPALSFHDFVLADRAAWPASTGYWQRALDGAPTQLASLPSRRQRVTAVEGTQVSIPLDPAVARLFGQLARDYRMSVSMVVAAAWGSVLALWSGSDDLVLALPVSGRTRPEYEDVIGCVFRWIFIRIRMDHAASLETALRQVRAAVLAGSDHQFLDYGRIHRQVRHPAYVRFESWGRPAHLPGLVSEHFDVPAGPNMRWPLAPGDPDSYPPELLVSQGEDGALTATLVFNALAYEADDMAELAGRAALAWTAMASAPIVTLRDLEGLRWAGSALDVE